MKPQYIEVTESMTVIVRDWLSANHIVLHEKDGDVLIDTGYVSDLEKTSYLIKNIDKTKRIKKIVNTHCHSDHMGGNAGLQKEYHCPILIPEGEADAVQAWDEEKLLLKYAGQEAEQFSYDELLISEQHYTWGGLDWKTISAPGHDDGTLVFYNQKHKILISADALWEKSFGFILPAAMNPHSFANTRKALNALSALDVKYVIPGHGLPFTDFRGALNRANKRLAFFEANEIALVQSGAKSLFIFLLLARKKMTLDEVHRCVQDIGFLYDINQKYLKMQKEDYVSWLINETVQSRQGQLHQNTLEAV